MGSQRGNKANFRFSLGYSHPILFSAYPVHPVKVKSLLPYFFRQTLWSGSRDGWNKLYDLYNTHSYIYIYVFVWFPRQLCISCGAGTCGVARRRGSTKPTQIEPSCSQRHRMLQPGVARCCHSVCKPLAVGFAFWCSFCMVTTGCEGAFRTVASMCLG